jgi:D-3-phosphoglycerate dehydrogenase
MVFLPLPAANGHTATMDLLIVEPLEAEVLQWLQSRHQVDYKPVLARDPRAFRQALFNVRAAILPPQVAVDAQTLQFAPMLRAVGRVSAGAENIDLEVCAKAQVEVVRSQTATAQAEAEFLIGALLALLRPSPTPQGLLAGRELGAVTVGLIGMSPPARAMSALLGTFGTRLVGYDPVLHASDSQWQRWRVQPLALRELLETADAVCVQLAYYSRYRALLGERYLAYCKPGQVLVSIAHGALFDEAALAAALKSGRLAAAWLDSLEPGAQDPGRPLHDIPSLLVTPRLAAYTMEARIRSAWAVARRIDEILTLTPATVREFRASRPGALAPAVSPDDEAGLELSRASR